MEQTLGKDQWHDQSAANRNLDESLLWLLVLQSIRNEKYSEIDVDGYALYF